MTRTLKNSLKHVSKKTGDEHLQEVRSRSHNTIRYRKRVQEEHEALEILKEFKYPKEGEEFEDQ